MFSPSRNDFLHRLFNFLDRQKTSKFHFLMESPFADLGFDLTSITQVTWTIQQCLTIFTFLELGVTLYQHLINIVPTTSATMLYVGISLRQLTQIRHVVYSSTTIELFPLDEHLISLESQTLKSPDPPILSRNNRHLLPLNEWSSILDKKLPRLLP
uniref:Uncharacterized protein n=1 Tax=Cucumis melo TaxID=3656 RepID=A0A9I9E216_CUCME